MALDARRAGFTDKPFTNLDHTNNPTISCIAPAECALALVVAARLRLMWIYDDQAKGMSTVALEARTAFVDIPLDGKPT
jgi:hypothetical protein